MPSPCLAGEDTPVRRLDGNTACQARWREGRGRDAWVGPVSFRKALKLHDSQNRSDHSINYC